MSRLEHKALAHRNAVNRNVRARDVDRLIERVYGRLAACAVHGLPGAHQ